MCKLDSFKAVTVCFQVHLPARSNNRYKALFNNYLLIVSVYKIVSISFILPFLAESQEENMDYDNYLNDLRSEISPRSSQINLCLANILSGRA